MKSVQCDLCPKGCIIKNGESGECRIRINLDGKLTAVTYAHPCSVHLDPIEKKPLFHFLPGTKILSLATVGCNLRCKNCQNWQISQANPEDVLTREALPEQVIAAAKRLQVKSIAYTYTEPLMFYEYTTDCSRLAKEAGLKNVLVTAAYLNPEPFKELCRVTDAANIDLKGITNKFYRDICGATLKPVLENLVIAKTMGLLVEVTHLIIPTLNDKEEEIQKLCQWIYYNLGADTPLHFSAFAPHYKLKHLPATALGTLEKARDIAHEHGLKHVYLGNVLAEAGGDTSCASCGEKVVRRRRYLVTENKLTASGDCPVCGAKVHGVWQ